MFKTVLDLIFVNANTTKEKAKLDRVIGFALAFATYAGLAEAGGRDFGFGSDSIECREKYMEWALEFDLLGHEYGNDQYEELSAFFAEKIKGVA